ncbi:MAG: DPP IV N-terminal domain-containing protein [Planctomycetes bacterium]|nr:DPP IV N-terminal domain-containing protein [Planctomycetota bacterium]
MLSAAPPSLLLLAVLVLAGSASPVAAQDDTRATLDRAEPRVRDIYEHGRFGVRGFDADWLPDGAGYVVRERRGDRTVRVRVDVASGERSDLDDPDRRALDRPDRTSPDGLRMVELRDGDLYVRDRSGGEPTRLTRNARPDDVHNGRAVWSPDGRRIAFVAADATQVRVRSDLLGDEPTYPSVRETRFARVGGTITTLQVGVVDVDSRALRWIDVLQPPEGFYLGQVDWAGNSDELLIEKLSRFRDEREFLLADLRSGAVTRIFHETDPAWVVASYQLNAGLEWIEGGHAFVVIHERDGWRHAWVYERNGAQRHLLTPGAFDIIERGVIDEVGGWFYFYASPDNATQRYLYRAPLDASAPPRRVTPADQPGSHDYEFAPDRRHAFHTWSSFDRPPVTELVELAGHRALRVLEDNATLREHVREAGYRDTEFLQLRIADDLTLDAWLMKPPGFDPARKYPVLVYVYSEPHAQTVLDRWGTAQADYHRLVADLGYLVVSMDSRGTPAPKGAAWRRAVFGSLGPLSTAEQAAGLRELARQRSYVDLERVGIWGWSGGGSNTLNAMFREPALYQVGIAVAAKPQPWLYNAWFQEIYMRTREVNPDGYQRSAPIHFAEGLRGDLLIIHGTGELNTHVQITEGLVDRLIELGKRFDYMSYPHRDHGIREGAGTSVHLRMLMIRYLLDHLAPGPR